MLVIVSDLHLKDGTSGSSISPDAFQVFAEWLRGLAYRASWRADGVYRPLEAFDLLLLGDILDLIRSERWLLKPGGGDEHLRPWDDPQSDAFVAKVVEITEAVLHHNRAALAVLRRMAQGEVIRLPAPRRDGLPDPEVLLPVKVRIHYMVGNHDWLLHLPGGAYDALRTRVIGALGLSNPPSPFPHQAEESDTLMSLLLDHRVYARHGDVYDAMNYHAALGRDHATVGDAMTIELLTRFPLEVRRQLGTEVPLRFVEGLKELSNVRPVLVTPMWVNNLIRDFGGDEAQSQAIKDVWNQAADRFLQSDFIRSQDQPLRLDVVDALEGALLFSKSFSFDGLERLARWAYGRVTKNTAISLADHALEEHALVARTVDFVVYGHTHYAETVPLDVYRRGKQTVSQVYYNTGTWHPYYELTLRSPQVMDFVGLQIMGYAAFFRGDEHGGRRAEVWTGALT
ncbi:MAG: hypothetical protein D6803_02880 [Anaerolineae bacterium]|nr:MAG: hypothetical protein D6803_02880 [Anaerolineae bacterium]